MKLSLFLSLRLRFRYWFDNHVARYLPRIPRKKPDCPYDVCHMCGNVQNKIYAYDGGDGWYFFWDCTNNCGDGDLINWFPFIFNWCNRKDLERIGIEVA